MAHWGTARAEPQDTELAAAAVTARGAVERHAVEQLVPRCGHLNGATFRYAPAPCGHAHTWRQGAPALQGFGSATNLRAYGRVVWEPAGVMGAWAPAVTPRFGCRSVASAWVVATDLPGLMLVARYQRMRQHWRQDHTRQICNHDCGGLGCRGHGGRMVWRACLLGVPVMSAAA